MKKCFFPILLALILITVFIPFTVMAARLDYFEVVELKYQSVGHFSEGFAAVELGNKWGFINKMGEEAVPLKYDSASHFSEGLAAVKQDGKWGFIDMSGKTVILFKYDSVQPFSEGLASVSINDKWGFIDKAGTVVVPLQYAYNGENYFSEGLVTVSAKGKDNIYRRGYIDKNGNVVLPIKYQVAGPFSEGLASVMLDGKWGYIDKAGNVVVQPKYNLAHPFSDGLACVAFKDSICENNVITSSYKYGYIDKNGKEVIPLKYDSAASFSEGVARVKFDGDDQEGVNYFNDRSGFIDKTGKELIPLEYHEVYDFSGGLALAYNYIDHAEGLSFYVEWFFVTNGGDSIPVYGYDQIEPLSEGIAAVKDDGKWGFIAITTNPLNTASTWAREGISSAIKKGFVPADIQNDYKKVITRAEFCEMAIKYIEYVKQKDIDMVLAEKGVNRDPYAFTDTSSQDILAAFALGVTKGTGNRMFTPNGQFNREQAATMLTNICRVLDKGTDSTPTSSFADMDSVSSWAVNGVNFCHANGIMVGTSKNTFSPKGPFTREQSIITFINIVEEIQELR